MPYRLKPAREVAPQRDLVTVRTYLDVVEAELARARLESMDIFAVVTEPTAFNPMLTAAAGGVQLRVRDDDCERAEDILAEAAAEPADADDGEGDDVVRCPRCELAYCSYGPRPVHGSTIDLPTLAAWLFARTTRSRWHCARCGHVWDDRDEGPRAMTRLPPDAPRAVFRLRRARAGTGLFVGLMIGVVGAFFAGALDVPLVAALLLVGAPFLGWSVGRGVRADVCSAPSCRMPMPPGAETCRKCKGTVAGSIDRAAEHYAAAADVRRELAALEKDEGAKRARRKRQRRAQAGAPEQIS